MDLEVLVTLGQIQVFIGGGLFQNVPVSGYTDVVNMFQQYRIDMIEMQMLYSNNVSQINNTLALPIVGIVADFEDFSGAATTKTALLQYEDLRVIQLGNTRTPDQVVFRWKPMAVTTSNSGVIQPRSGEWFSSLTTATQMSGVKMFYDPVGTTGTTSVGALSLYFRVHISARKTN